MKKVLMLILAGLFFGNGVAFGMEDKCKEKNNYKNPELNRTKVRRAKEKLEKAKLAKSEKAIELGVVRYLLTEEMKKLSLDGIGNLKRALGQHTFFCHTYPIDKNIKPENVKKELLEKANENKTEYRYELIEEFKNCRKKFDKAEKDADFAQINYNYSYESQKQ
jgi:hypothetical protein